MKAIIITIGDEILIGQIVDTNSAWIANKIEEIGIEVVEMRSISDTRNAILSSLSEAEKSAEIVILTGGLGPTKDDITKNVLAEYFADEMVYRADVFDHVSALLARYNIEASAIHTEQCYFPSTARLFTNKRGTAPGMFFEKNGVYHLSVPGVPNEMKYLIGQELIPYLKTKIKTNPILHKTILTVGKGEGVMAEMLEDILNEMPEQLSIAYLPGIGSVRLRLSIRGIENETKARALLEAHVDKIVDILAPWVYGYDEEQLSDVVGQMIARDHKMLGTAESCTGGNIGHKITSISGSSAYYVGGVISYSNIIKETILGVESDTIKKYGAVSEQTVTEMALGCLEALGCDYAIATTGIAGPDGGTEEKPVGTIWIAVTNGLVVKTRLLKLGNGRLKNIEYTTIAALGLMRKMLLKNT